MIQVIHMTLRLAISMQKGGVGKTVTTQNVAGALAARGHDVLAVDADPQGALTWKLGLKDQYLNAEDALYDVLLDHGGLDLDHLTELIVPSAEFDIVPSHIRNFRLEKELYMASRTEERLRTALERSDVSAYDFILIDSPPNLGPLADGSILAAGHVLFPSHANEVAQHNLELLFDEIDTLEEVYDDYSITTVGAVLNQVETDNVSMKWQSWFEETFGAENVFQVPDRKAIEHAIEHRSTVFGYDPDEAGYPWDTDSKSDLENAYDRIAAHVESYA
jgi:chromosome partitioning protein